MGAPGDYDVGNDVKTLLASTRERSKNCGGVTNLLFDYWARRASVWCFQRAHQVDRAYRFLEAERHRHAPMIGVEPGSIDAHDLVV